MSSWNDGLRPDDALGPHAPALRALAAAGARARLVPATPSSTYPNHMTLLTGALPAAHGIFANMPFDPLYKNADGWFWYHADVRVPTLWSAARAAGLKTLNLEWPVSVGAPVDLNVPQYWRAGTADDAKLLAALATPGLLARIEALTGAPYPTGGDIAQVDADAARAGIAARLIAIERPALTTLFWAASIMNSTSTAPARRRQRRCCAGSTPRSGRW